MVRFMLTNICRLCDSYVDANRVILVLRNGSVELSDFSGAMKKPVPVANPIGLTTEVESRNLSVL